MTVATQLVTEFKFPNTVSPLRQYGAALGLSNLKLGAFIAVSATAAAAAAKLASNVLLGVDSLARLSAQTGVATDRLQVLSFQAEQTGSTAEAMRSTIQSLTSAIGNAAERGSPAFARLGISVRDANGQLKTADVVLGQVRTRMRQLGLSMAQQQSIASSLGIDRSLIGFISATDEQMGALERRARSLGVLTGEQAKTAVEYANSLRALRFAMDAVRQLIAVGLGPAMTELVETFTAWLAQNREFIQKVASRFINALKSILGFAERLGPAFLAYEGAALAAKVATIGLDAALLGLGKTAKAVAFFGLLLALDDLIVATRGGKSVIRGLILEAFDVDITPLLQNMTRKIRAFVKEIREILASLFTGDFFGAGEQAETLTIRVSKQMDALARALVPESLVDEFDALLKLRDRGDKALVDLVASLNSLGLSSLSPNEPSLGLGTSLSGEVPGTVRQGDRIINQDVTINVRTDDARGTAKAVLTTLERQLRDAEQQLKVRGR